MDKDGNGYLKGYTKNYAKKDLINALENFD